MKFIHLSNVNLGISPDFPLPIDRAEDFRADFRAVISACNEEKADLLFITGNLFASVPAEEDLKAVDEILSGLQSTRVFILTGNQDAPELSDALTKYCWNSDTTVFSGECIQRVYTSKLNCEITGVGYAKETWDKVKPETLARGKKGAIQILLLPFLGDQDSDAGLQATAFPFDYVGLGQRVYFRSENGKTVYAPGPFEPLGFTNQLKHGYFVGNIQPKEKNRTTLDLKFVKGASREYLTLQVNATKEVSYDEVEKKIKEIIAEKGSENIYRVVLKGEASPSLYFMKDGLLKLGNVLSVADETDEDGTIRELKLNHAGDALGRFIEELLLDGDEETRRKALYYGVDALLRSEEEEKA